MSAPIVSFTQYQDYIRNEGSGIEVATLQSFLDASIEGFANATGRYLTLVDDDTQDSTWLIAADPCSNILRIPDCTSITSITENGTVVAASAYQAEPVNQKSLSGEFRPYEQIRKLRSYWYTDYGRAAILLTGKLGWSAFPAGMVEAIKILGKELCNNQDVRLGTLTVPEGVIWGIRTNKVVREAVNTYARVETVGLA
jgi:hypothetical protein